MVRRLPIFVLLFTWLMLGTGTMEFLHDLQHEVEDAVAHASHSHHDESNCPVHAQLHAPTIGPAVVALLDSNLPLVERVACFEQSVRPQAHCCDLSCRGPPAC
jgi:hypothetical protein